MKTLKTLWMLGLMVQVSAAIQAQTGDQPAESPRLNAGALSGLRLRSIGPAVRSGRIADIAKDPTDPSTWYVAVSSGGVWKTVNNGTSWDPIFDDYGAYSTSRVVLDPQNPHVVWLGTGENASQRSAGYGDGVYKSLNGGKSWKRVGLESSEHIGKILIDPRDSNVVYVAAEGPLWAPGGDRGLFKTTDGGSQWEQVLEISENTGVTDIVFDPRDPDVLYAAAYQRRRHVGILVAGGPESALYKTTDGGANWKRLSHGLPRGEVGRIALAVSPQKPDVVYALIAAEESRSGFYRSEDRGESWEKRSGYIVVDPQYYGEIYADPHQFDRVYAMDVIIHLTSDGGKSFQRLNTRNKHVDNHAMLFDPLDPEYLMVGCDGGIYESWDRGDSWRFIDNLPITQFYRVGLDNATPFYNVYGGTQDNATLGGPSRTLNVHGIRNSDWFVTIGGDGFQTRVDPQDPNILYSQYQYAGIVRFDRRSGERLEIQPQPEAGEPALRWHWDSPLLISPHSQRRIYFAANRLFRSDDRAHSWKAVSPDLSRGEDRNQREVMGRIWSPEAVWKNVFTSPYGTIVAFDESPQVEGLLYAGSDDGLVQVSEDSGANWRRIDRFPGLPERAYVADLAASRHARDRVYAVFNNHKEGDFAPYLLRSDDRGRSWQSITSNLPDRHIAWSLVEDHIDPGLLFVATEFGLFFSPDGGADWIQLKGGMPTIAVRDLEIQRRENDLVAASFGRGFYILDDYSPLRGLSEKRLDSEAILFPVKTASTYIVTSPMGGGPKASQGDGFYVAPNPPFGAVFTYYLKEGLQTRHQKRKGDERQAVKQGEDVGYPSWDELREEDRQQAPSVLLTVFDQAGNLVRRLEAPRSAGFHRLAWDLRHPAARRTGRRRASGPLAVPGSYQVQLSRIVDGVAQQLSQPQPFEVVPLGNATLPAADAALRLEFEQRVAELQAAVLAAGSFIAESLEGLGRIRAALMEADIEVGPLLTRAEAVRLTLMDLQERLEGDETRRKRAEFVAPAVEDRVQRIVRALWASTADATQTHRRSYEVAANEFEEVYATLRLLLQSELADLHRDLDRAGVRWTPGRPLPEWPRR